MSAIVRILKIVFVVSVIAAIAFVVYRHGKPAKQGNHPLVVHLQRVRTDSEQLLTHVSAQIESFDKTLADLANGMSVTHGRVSQFDEEIADTLESAAEQKQSLARFSDLLVDEQGVVLANGTYISQRDVRDQLQFEEAKLATIQQRIGSLTALRGSALTLHSSLEQQHDRAKAARLKLSEAKQRLEAQLTYIATLSDAMSGNVIPNSFASDLERLESDVAGLQDQLDIYMNGLPGTLAIDQLKMK